MQWLRITVSSLIEDINTKLESVLQKEGIAYGQFCFYCQTHLKFD